MSNLESNVFGKKKFSDILKEIYDNQKKKEQQIYPSVLYWLPNIKNQNLT